MKLIYSRFSFSRCENKAETFSGATSERILNEATLHEYFIEDKNGITRTPPGVATVYWIAFGCGCYHNLHILYIDRPNIRFAKGFHKKTVLVAWPTSTWHACLIFNILIFFCRVPEAAQLIKDNDSINSISKESRDGKQVDDNNKWKKCIQLRETPTDITTMDEYKKFDFQPTWLRNKEFWDNSFEARFEQFKKNTTKPNLKVWIAVDQPHGNRRIHVLYSISGVYRSVFAQRPRMAENIFELLSKRFSSNIELCDFKNARVQRHDIYLVRN